MRLQRALYERLRGYAHKLGHLSPELRRYFQEYQRDFQDFREVSTKRELLAALQKTHIAFCGDYHTLSQAQKTVIRVLRDSVLALKKRDRSLVLALEMVQARHNAKIQRFLEGGMSEAEFLKSIGFHRNWGFSWENYRKLFQFAKEHGIAVVGINRPGKDRYPTLRERDRYAAEVIADLTEKDPKTLVFVLVGDLHLASSHLPGELDKQLKRRKLARERIVILQNNERFYWKLVALGLEQLIDVVKVKENVYCVMNTPPWVKLKSHLKWAEVMAEASPPAAAAAEKGAIDVAELLHEVEYSDEIREILEVVQKFIGIAGPADDDFSVHTPADMSFLNRVEKDRAFTPVERAILRQCLATFESHFIPRENILYLTSLSLNHAAKQASIYLHAKTSGFRRLFASPRRDFYTFVWIEALGFVGSKIINHKRKCDGPKDLERIVQKGKSRREVEIAKAALAHLEAESRFRKSGGKRFVGIVFPKGRVPLRRVIFFYRVAKRLGALLGEALYNAAMDNRIERDDLRALFECDFPAASARKLYLDWIRRLDEHGYRHVVKTERL